MDFLNGDCLGPYPNFPYVPAFSYPPGEIEVNRKSGVMFVFRILNIYKNSRAASLKDECMFLFWSAESMLTELQN